MKTIANTAQNVNKSCSESASVLHNSENVAALMKPNLWIPGTEPEKYSHYDYRSKRERQAANLHSSTNTIIRTRDGISIVCPCCGEIKPGVVSDFLTGHPVRLTYDVWWRFARTMVRCFSCECEDCGATFEVSRTATIARTPEAIAIESEEWGEFEQAANGSAVADV